LTTLRPFTAKVNYDHISRRLEHEDGDADLGVRYIAPRAGARKRQDGVEVKWEVSRPQFAEAKATPPSELFPTTRIDAPFFCHDVTARSIRVQFDEDDLITHPCKAHGIAGVDVLVPPDKLTAYTTLYSSLTGVAPDQITNGSGKKGCTFKLTTPTSQGAGPVIRVRVPTSDADQEWLRTRGIGIREIQLSISGRKNHGEEKLAPEGLGSTISLVW
jgi:hypothetical protein